MKKAIIAIVVLAIVAIGGIGIGYYFSQQNASRARASLPAPLSTKPKPGRSPLRMLVSAKPT